MNVIDGRECGSAEEDQGVGMKKGWTWKPLGEVCKTGSGGTPLSSRKEFYEGGTITKAGLESSAARLF
jgi:hypothetical protein